jgi:hypothetical protein
MIRLTTASALARTSRGTEPDAAEGCVGRYEFVRVFEVILEGVDEHASTFADEV